MLTWRLLRGSNFIREDDMTEEDIRKLFSASHPKACDVSQAEYEGSKELFDRVCAETGFRLAGFREKRAVFTTKPAPPAPIEQPTMN